MFSSISRSVRNDIDDIMTGGRFYCTTEIGRELNAIRNSIGHLSLDGEILESSQHKWKRRFEPPETTSSRAAAQLDNVSKYLSIYKTQMHNDLITTKQENQLRELHHWAIENLSALKQGIEPLNRQASDRINQFSDHVGVTDRYLGYRHNLTRPGPLHEIQRPHTAYPRLQTMEADQLLERERDLSVLGTKVKFASSLPQKSQYRGYRTIDTIYPNSRSRTAFSERPLLRSQVLDNTKRFNQLNGDIMASLSRSRTFASNPPLSVQEQAGINTVFPGISEYTQRYESPPSEGRTPDFIINPTPDFTRTGRPLAPGECFKNDSEYQTRYEWPDANKIVPNPWLRK